jgi:DNA-binding winged helix-turn-helix (wHTH) protein
LAKLLESPGKVVSHQDLYWAAWKGTVVEYDQNLRACIRDIRQALGDDVHAPRFVETLPRRGYRFIG